MPFQDIAALLVAFYTIVRGLICLRNIAKWICENGPAFYKKLTVFLSTRNEPERDTTIEQLRKMFMQLLELLKEFLDLW